MVAQFTPLAVGLAIGWLFTARSYPRPRPYAPAEGFAAEEMNRINVATHAVLMVGYRRQWLARALTFAFWSWMGWGVSNFVIAMVSR